MTTCCTNLLPIFVVMRFGCFLLSCWVLVLSIWPCADACHHAHVEVLGIPGTELPASQTSHEEAEGLCSPFCLCSTCHGFVPQPGPVPPVMGTETAAVRAAPRYFYRLPPLPEGTSRFWQPPKV